MTRKVRSGFTLVEILIVVVILGILAAIVIPQFTSASETAKSSSLTSQLQTIRAQLELYQVQHNGDYPEAGVTAVTGSTGDWSALTETTDVSGDVAGSDYGPYLQKAPVNPFVNESDVAADNSAAWEYTAATGNIRAVIPAGKWSDIDDLGLGDPAIATNSDVVQGPAS